ncbi:MAG: hypothetical protein GXO89_09320 [Chlorobi bacterium]|nr:hypothetical protein [Chlorobiota bacterium]
MKYKHIYLIALVFMFFTGCSTSQKLKDFSGNKIIFGSYGGFTGVSDEYVLHYNGRIEKINGLTRESDYALKIADQKAKKIFLQFLSNGLDTLEYSSPGNISYFVGYKNDSITKKIVWGGEGSAPEKARQTYTNLVQLIKNK